MSKHGLISWRTPGGLAACLALALGCAALAGCGGPPPVRFHANLVAMHHGGLYKTAHDRDEQKKSDFESESPPDKSAWNADWDKKWEADEKTRAEQRQSIADALEALFGTPDKPEPIKDLGLRQDLLDRAAGPVGTVGANTQHGLFREHCVHCHGISGDGDGPTALFLNPYPRDYRPGIFKFKSTERPEPPTDHDLRRTLHEGIPGTAMPSFRLLPEEEIDALVEYVKYLSMRGMAELAMIEVIKADDKLTLTRADLVEDMLQNKVIKHWKGVESKLVKVPEKPKAADNPDFELAKSIAIGRTLFYRNQTKTERGANCFSCHGPSAMGDDGAERFDDWQKDEKPDDVALGALPKRIIAPRNIRTGVFRGGRRPLDIFYRISTGINGTPMPDGKLLTPDEIWHLVDYVRSLPFEPESELSTADQTAGLQRDGL